MWNLRLGAASFEDLFLWVRLGGYLQCPPPVLWKRHGEKITCPWSCGRTVTYRGHGSQGAELAEGDKGVKYAELCRTSPKTFDTSICQQSRVVVIPALYPRFLSRWKTCCTPTYRNFLNPWKSYDISYPNIPSIKNLGKIGINFLLNFGNGYFQNSRFYEIDRRLIN